MSKKRYKTILIIGIIFLLALNVNATSKTYNYKDINNNPITNAKLYIYGCTDSSCSLLTSSWNSPTSTTTSSITIGDTPSSYNKEFHYISCYKVLETSMAYPSTFYDGGTASVSMQKKSSCSSTPSNLQIIGTKEINNQLTINLDLAEVFSSSVSNLPTEVKSFYDAETEVKLFIRDLEDNTNNYEDIKTIIVPEGDTKTSFIWTPASTGDYEIKVITEIIDCKCYVKSNLETSTLITIIESTLPPQEPQCPTCPLASAWSTCIASEQTQTYYECNQTTNYICNPLTRTQSCVMPPTGLCGADQECKKDKTVCTSGDPDCSCATLLGDLCTNDETCTGNSLLHHDSGICCSVTCITKPQTCTTGMELCEPDENGCPMFRKCINNKWTVCEKLIPTCTGSKECSDGTPAGKCSAVTIGKICINGNLEVDAELCPTTLPTPTDCTPLWNCLSWLDCDSHNYKKCNQWFDENHCNKGIPPNDEQECGYKSPYEMNQLEVGIVSGYGSTQPSQQEPSTFIKEIANKIMSIPRSFDVKVGFELPIILFIVAVVIASFILYGYTHKDSFIHKKKSVKKSKKTKTKPVKLNDLLLSVVESLKGNEKKIVDRLLEEEGLTPKDLKSKLGLTKTKLDIALTKLERRQIIKERKDYNSGIFFNDWIK